MNPLLEQPPALTRREFFGRTRLPASAPPRWRRCSAATASLRPTPADSPRVGGLPGLPHFAPKAKRVIYLFQNGAPDARRSVRLQAEARRRCTASRSPRRPSAASGFSTMTGGQKGKLVLARDRAVQAARPERRLGQRLPAAHRRDRRRPLLRQVDAHRRGQPRPGHHASSSPAAEHARPADAWAPG